MNFFGHVKPYNYTECPLDENSMGTVAVMPGWNNALNIIWLAVFSNVCNVLQYAIQIYNCVTMCRGRSIGGLPWMGEGPLRVQMWDLPGQGIT